MQGRETNTDAVNKQTQKQSIAASLYMVNTDCYIHVQAFHKPIAQLHSAVHIPRVIHQLIGHSHEHYFKDRQITCKVPRDTYNH